MTAVRAGGNGNKSALKLPDGQQISFFMPATVTTVVDCFQKFKSVTLETVENMIKAVKEFYDEEANLFRDEAQGKLKKLAANDAEARASLDADYAEELRQRDQIVIDTKEKWTQATEALEKKAPAEE